MKNLFISILITLLFISCTTNIQEINSNPGQFDNKEVTIKGKVTSNNTLIVKYYEVTDETGSIYVIPKDEVPDENQEVKVTGVVKQLIKIGTLNVTAIEESKK